MATSTIDLSTDDTPDGTVMGSGTVTTKRKAVKPKVNKSPTASEKLPPNPFVHEILDRVNAQRSVSKRIEVLEEYRNDALTAILIWNFDESIESVVPEGVVPYEKNAAPLGTDHTTLRREWKNLYNFVKGGNSSLSNIRRETMFIQMLEGLHPDEADILCLVKDKQLFRKYPKINQGIVAQAFPDIKWGDRVVA